MDNIPPTPGVYILTNTLNGKVYIGSSVDMRKRCKEHAALLDRGTHHNAHLQSAWTKHGRDAFRFDVLEPVEHRDRSATVAVEQKWLDFYQAAERRDCYNALPLAHTTAGRIVSEETRRKMSEAQRGRLFTPETRAKMRAARVGMKLSAEHRAAIGRASTGRPGPRPTPEALAAYRKLSPGQVRELRRLYAEGVPAPELARRYGIGNSTAYRIIKRENYRSVE